MNKLDFSNEEFNIMVDELLNREPMSFTMLCEISAKTLRNKIKYWCSEEPCLKGRGYEEDILHDVQIKLMRITVPCFLLRNGLDEPVNADPDGFKNWMITVAKNYKRDFANKIRNEDFKVQPIDNEILERKLIAPEPEIDECQLQLKEAFSIVLSADVNVYKVLTWLAQFLFIIKLDMTKIQSNDAIIEAFEEKTLFDMYVLLLEMSEQILWIEITTEQNERILKDLNKIWKDDIKFGSVKYKEFFMKVKGNKEGKKSISDWVNRMNNIVRRKTGLK